MFRISYFKCHNCRKQYSLSQVLLKSLSILAQGMSVATIMGYKVVSSKCIKSPAISRHRTYLLLKLQESTSSLLSAAKAIVSWSTHYISWYKFKKQFSPFLVQQKSHNLLASCKLVTMITGNKVISFKCSNSPTISESNLT